MAAFAPGLNTEWLKHPMSKAEIIVCAAIRYPVEGFDQRFKGRRVYPEYLTISAPPPARHGSLLHPFIERTGIRIACEDQGFLTSTGRFVGRKEAHDIAVASGQPLIDHPSRIEGTLYSEDLW